MVGWNVDISSLSPPLTIARENMVNPNMNSDSRSTNFNAFLILTLTFILPFETLAILIGTYRKLFIIRSIVYKDHTFPQLRRVRRCSTDNNEKGNDRRSGPNDGLVLRYKTR